MAAATYQISAPEGFCFSTPTDWPKWRKRFERFRLASGLDKGTEEKQVNELIYLMGEQAEDIFLAFGLTPAEQKIYATVIGKFEGYFIRKRNVIFERAKFNRRIQQDGEPVQDFITALHALAEHCDYGNLHDDLIRDRIVVGVRDTKLSDRFQLLDDLTLEKAITMARQSEEVKNQADFVRGAKDSTLLVSKVESKNKLGPKNSTKSNFHEQRSFASKFTKPCSWCGSGTKHDREKCPASGQECYKCKKRGHFSKVCKLPNKAHCTIKGVQQVEESLFLGNLKSVRSPNVEPPWTVSVLVDQKPIVFEIDTGADVTVVPETVYRALLADKQVEVSDRIIAGATMKQFPTLGFIQVTLKYKERETQQPIYIVKGLRSPLLSRQAVTELQLVQRIGHLNSPISNYANEIEREFSDLFTGLGKLDQYHHIQLKTDAKPYALTTPRRVPIPLMDKVKAELERMVSMGVISPVEQPTAWCAPMVIVPKPSGDIRICVDLTELNRNVLREQHPMPVVDHTLAQLKGATYFSKLDANTGFWQVQLTPESALLTTFITPFGRFHYNRLPFGITSAPEHFQRRMSLILEGIPGVLGHNDDTLVHGASEQEHDTRLRKVLQRIRKAGMTLNLKKCEFKVTQVKFLGHIVDSDGIRPDPSKLEAVRAMREPTTVTEVKRFIGMTNYLGKFIPRLADIQKPITALLSSKVDWVWEEPQRQAFQDVKNALTSHPILALYDPAKDTFVSADASSYGIGCVLLQKQGDGCKRPVAYASRTFTECETRYAQIEKEALAQVWACEKFHDYIMGLTVSLETDHLPLVPIFTSKPLDDLTPRLQRLRIRMMRYSYNIYYTPGKDLLAADALSREPLPEQKETDLEADIGAYVQMIVSSLPASEQRLKQIKNAQKNDIICKEIASYCQEGWPEKRELKASTQEYWQYRYEIAMQEGLLAKGSRLIIPKELQTDIINKIHEGHQGITKCRARARESVWWPGLSKQLEEKIRQCSVCIQHAVNRHEPLMPSTFPDRPWQKAALDLLMVKGEWHLIVSDYYSRFFEIEKLKGLKAKEVIETTKSVFARHGVPEEVYSDQGPQFGVLHTSEFREFSREYGFVHKTSSARFPQSNGFIEAAVKVAKARFEKSGDPYRALLAYRSTPLANGFSPAELCMNRRLRTTVPMLKSQLKSRVPPQDILRQRENSARSKQAFYYNRHHGVRTLNPLSEGETVWITNASRPGIIKKKKEQPRSYKIDTGDTIIDRNRFHLIPAPSEVFQERDTDQQWGDELENLDNSNHAVPPVGLGNQRPKPRNVEGDNLTYFTRSGRGVRKPNRLDL